MRLERRLPGSEHVGPFASDHMADKLDTSKNLAVFA